MRRICELGLIRAQAFSAQGRLREAGDIYSSLQRTLNEAGADMIVKYGVAYGRFLLAQGDYLTAVTVLGTGFAKYRHLSRGHVYGISPAVRGIHHDGR